MEGEDRGRRQTRARQGTNGYRKLDLSSHQHRGGDRRGTSA